MVFQTLSRLSSKRVPLIKFRKGGNATPVSSASANSANQASESSKPAASQTQAATSAPIEDWALPPRYWRKPIDPIEEEYINRGGPA